MLADIPAVRLTGAGGGRRRGTLRRGVTGRSWREGRPANADRSLLRAASSAR
jgi:hypothetical protein